MKKLIAITILVLLLTANAYSTEYYISTSGSDTNAGTYGTPWKTINKANTTLKAGDTVYIRAGTYQVGNAVGDGGSISSQGIAPSNSGTSGNPITYSAYSGEVVKFVGISDGTTMRAQGVNLNEKSYIHITGNCANGTYNMQFTNMGGSTGSYNNVNIDGDPSRVGNINSRYNEIDHCEFGKLYIPATIDDQTVTYRGINVIRAQYNYIHDNSIHDWQVFTSSWDGPSCLEIGADDGTTPTTNYNVVENNLVYRCGHHCIGVGGMYNVVRNNILHNENNYQVGGLGTKYGYRNMITGGNSYRAGTNIIEGNRFGHTGISKLSLESQQRGGSAISLASSNNWFRYNIFYENLTMGIYVRAYPNNDNGHGEAFSNHIYNNTFYRNGYSLEPYYLDTSIYDADYYERFPIVFDNYFQDNSLGAPGAGFHDAGAGNPVIANNVVKNNLFVSSWPKMADAPFLSALPVGTGANTRPYTQPLVVAVNFKQGSGSIPNQIIANNLEVTGSASSYFKNADTSDPMSTTLPDLTFASGSSALDSASYLTLANGAGSNSTTLVVDDARYFQDGKFGLGTLSWPSSVTMSADWIAIGTVSNTVQIFSINYSTNTIILASPMTWSDNAPIWLYKISDGKRVLYGSASDYGAHEAPDYGAPSPPVGLRIIVQ